MDRNFATIKTELLLDDAIKLMSSKGNEYASTDDVLKNFKDIAQLLGLSVYEVWAVYFNKHTMLLNNLIQRYKSDLPNAQLTEGIYSRVLDIINYAVLLYLLYNEDQLK